MGIGLYYICGVLAFLLVVLLTDAPPWSWRVPVGLSLLCGLWPLLVALVFYTTFRPSPAWFVAFMRWIHNSDYWES